VAVRDICIQGGEVLVLNNLNCFDLLVRFVLASDTVGDVKALLWFLASFAMCKLWMLWQCCMHPCEMRQAEGQLRSLKGIIEELGAVVPLVRGHNEAEKFKTFARMGGQPIQIDKAVSGLSFVLESRTRWLS